MDIFDVAKFLLEPLDLDMSNEYDSSPVTSWSRPDDQLIASHDLLYSTSTDINFSYQNQAMPSRTVGTDNLQSSPSRIFPLLVPQGAAAFQPSLDNHSHSGSSLKLVYYDPQTSAVERLPKKPRQTRRRVNHACDQCRSRKQRCTGGPICERCRKRKSNCKFSKIQDHPSSPSLKVSGDQSGKK